MGSQLLSILTPSKPNVADAATIIQSIQRIEEAAISFKLNLTAWDGGTLGSLPLISKSNAVIADVNASIALVRSAAPLTLDEATQIIAFTRQVAVEAGEAVNAAIAAKPKFENIVLGITTAISLLRGLQDAAKVMSETLLDKTPVGKLDSASLIADQFHNHFTRGLMALASRETEKLEVNMAKEEVMPEILSL